MKKIFLVSKIVVLFILMISFKVSAGELVRIYCKTNNNVIIEDRLDANYNDKNKIYEFPNWTITRNQFPQYEYIEQLRCSGSSLTVDHNFKPEWAIRKDQLKQTQTALDAELGKAEPDVITVLRLQRAIEILKEGK